MKICSDVNESSAILTEAIFPFEANFSSKPTCEWMSRHRHQVFYYIGVYLLMIFYGQEYMKDRPRMTLRRSFTAWNILLSAFSIIGLCRMLPEEIKAFRHFGFPHLACNLEYNVVSGYWSWLFALSKVLELGDTVFLILRKQKLIFLHWYHHITVLVFTWYSYSEYTPFARMFILMNYLAHSLMYPYFTFRSMRVAVPSIFAIAITSVQVTQMVIGCYICYYVYAIRSKGQYCDSPDYIAIFGMLMYFSYFVLFLRFFYHRYLTTKRKEEKLS